MESTRCRRRCCSQRPRIPTCQDGFLLKASHQCNGLKSELASPCRMGSNRKTLVESSAVPSQDFWRISGKMISFRWTFQGLPSPVLLNWGGQKVQWNHTNTNLWSKRRDFKFLGGPCQWHLNSPLEYKKRKTIHLVSPLLFINKYFCETIGQHWTTRPLDSTIHKNKCPMTGSYNFSVQMKWTFLYVHNFTGQVRKTTERRTASRRNTAIKTREKWIKSTDCKEKYTGSGWELLDERKTTVFCRCLSQEKNKNSWHCSKPQSSLGHFPGRKFSQNAISVCSGRNGKKISTWFSMGVFWLPTSVQMLSTWKVHYMLHCGWCTAAIIKFKFPKSSMRQISMGVDFLNDFGKFPLPKKSSHGRMNWTTVVPRLE